MEHRVLFVNETANIGGGEINLLLILRNIVGSGWEPVVVVPEEGPLVGKIRNLNIPVFIVPGCPHWSISFYILNRYKIPNPLAWLGNLLIGFVWILRLRTFYVSYPNAVIHTNSMLAHLYAGIAARLSGKPVVWHFQDIVSKKEGMGVYHKVLLLIASWVPTRIICVSDIVMKQFQGNATVAQKVILLMNTIDARQLNDAVDRQPLNSVLHIGTAARITPWKGQEEALKVARLLQQKGIPFCWKFAGDTALGSKQYNRHLLDLVQIWKLNDSIQFLGWIEDMPAFYRSIDVLVHLPTEPEPYGLIIAEAVAYGLPVITTHCGADQVVTTTGGNIVPLNHPDMVAENLETIWKQQTDWATQRRFRKQIAAELFDLNNYKNKLISIYKSASI